MEPITIILTVVGVLLLVGSCFLPAKESENQENDYDELVKRFEKLGIRYYFIMDENGKITT